jgi:hypothetical protein
MSETSGTPQDGRSEFGRALDEIFGVVRPEQMDAVESEAAQLDVRVTGLLRARETGTRQEREAADGELEQIRTRLLGMRESVLRGSDTILTLGALAGQPAPPGGNDARRRGPSAAPGGQRRRGTAPG